jgi:hypothetical protein
MGDNESFRKFQYRFYRMATGFDVDFSADKATAHGICTDVSDAGIRAEFDDSVVVGCSGLLTLRHPIGVLKLSAQVAHFEKCQVGLVFLLSSPLEHRITGEFIAAIANYTDAPPVIRFS